MRVATLYDVHGNLPALEAVLADLSHAGPDVIVVGGDVVLGPMPGETLDRLRALPRVIRFIRGNTERYVLGEENGEAPDQWSERTRWVRARLNASQRRFLATFPQTDTLDVPGLGRVLFCHGSPRSNEEIITPAIPSTRLQGILTDVPAAVVVCGHTHIQFDRTVEGIRLVNSGSVGMPYERDPGAYWAMLGARIEFRRTAYDVDAAARRIAATDFPGGEDFARQYVLTRPTPDQAIEAFEARAERQAAGAPQ